MSSYIKRGSVPPPSEPHFLSFIIIRYQHYSDMKINSWDIDYLILSV